MGMYSIARQNSRILYFASCVASVAGKLKNGSLSQRRGCRIYAAIVSLCAVSPRRCPCSGVHACRTSVTWRPSAGPPDGGRHRDANADVVHLKPYAGAIFTNRICVKSLNKLCSVGSTPRTLVGNSKVNHAATNVVGLIDLMWLAEGGANSMVPTGSIDRIGHCHVNLIARSGLADHGNGRRL